ncbi:hypothetical protein JW933_05930, partial [candidate division FCPU426 bacterium]|nr:hypothetical protein [candidate division FCPU426 bacterium]
MSRRFIFYLVFMSLFFVQTHSSWGTTVLGGSAGNGEDSNAATFHFNGDSVDFQMTKPDGTSLVNGEMAYEYGQSFEILKSGADYIVPRALQVTGANLSGSNWTTYAYPPYNHVALDPATGRIKFSTQSAWQEAEGIDINEPYPFFSNVPDVETSDAGYAIAAWDQEDASYVRVWANVYSPQSGWYGAVTIDADTGHTAGYPVIAMNSSGQAICTFWQIDSGGVGRVYVVHYQPGVGWYGRVTVNAASGYDAFLPDVAMNDAGQAICVFFQSDATASRIYATRYVPNVGWYTAVTIQVYNNNYGADYPRIAINDAGYALCAFLQPDATTTRACANRYVPGAGWQGAVAVDNGSANPASEARAAINDNNQGFVFFEQTDPSGTPHQRIYVNEYTSSWLLSPYAIDDANLTTNAGYPEIASNNSGQLVCVFNQTDAVTNRSYANRY